MKKFLLYGFKIFLLLICLGILIVLINIFLNQYYFITEYQINSSKIPNNFDDYKIIQLTDIHSIRSTNQKDELVNKIKKQNPDIIFITGDLIDAGYYSEQNNKYEAGEVNFPDELTKEFVIELTDITNVYLVYGNHEMMLLDNPENNILKTSLEENGVTILNNMTDEIFIGEESINLVGVQDPATLYKDKKYAYVGDTHKETVEVILNDLFADSIDEKFTILLSHRPEYFDLYTNYPIDLALTGHTHGGVVVLPFIGGIYAHPQGWFPEYVSGMYSKDNFDMIIGRGIGYSQLPIRIFNPPEIVEITLNKTN